jgi:murein DD-endopeptidase MepM/ murein hydrolase activator NlpD
MKDDPMRLLFLSPVLLLMAAGAACADGLIPPPKAAKLDGASNQIVLGPIYKERHFCSEHTAISWDLGDSLATDCIIVSDFGHGFPKFYRTDGKANADWFGWHADVLAPVDGTVAGVVVNPVENTPGTFGKGQASAIQIRTPQNQMVILVHVTNIRVAVGDTVKTGQVVAQVGNSGVADAPHTHVGAYDLGTNLPLQIRWDLAAQGRLSGEH